MGEWCVPVGTEVIQVYLRYGCYHSWTELSRSKRAKFNLVANMLSKEDGEKFRCLNSGWFEICRIKFSNWKLVNV